MSNKNHEILQNDYKNIKFILQNKESIETIIVHKV